MKGFVTNRIPDPAWPGMALVRVLPLPNDPWGVLTYLRGTDWERLIPTVTEDHLDMALRGHATPLVRTLGPPPPALARWVPALQQPCAHRNACIAAGPACVPGPKVPVCWEGGPLTPADPAAPPGLDRLALNYVVRCWQEGHYVVVVVPRPSS